VRNFISVISVLVEQLSLEKNLLKANGRDRISLQQSVQQPLKTGISGKKFKVNRRKKPSALPPLGATITPVLSVKGRTGI
jgi:hypothetical protein